jgi:hypothetical protein
MGSASMDEGGALNLSSFDWDLFERNRYAHLPKVLSDAALRTLSKSRPPSLNPLIPRAGKVTQSGSAGLIVDRQSLEMCRRIEHDILGAIPESFELPHYFAFNELLYQRYSSEGYISPHRDHVRYVGLIALVTLEGSATFSVLQDRDLESTLAKWEVSPGDIIFLRGADSDGVGRCPFHCVGGTIGGSRTMISMRCDRDLINAGGPTFEA